MSGLPGLRFAEWKFKSRPLMPLTVDDQLNPLLPTFVSAPLALLRLPGRSQASNLSLSPQQGAGSEKENADGCKTVWGSITNPLLR